MPTAKLTYRVNGGAPLQGASIIQPGDVVQFDASSYAGWGTPVSYYEFPKGRYPESWPCPSGWLDNAGSYQYIVSSIGGLKPPPVTFPGTGGIWGGWLPRLFVNGRVVDESVKLTIVSPTLGLEKIVAYEEQQVGGPDRGTTKAEQSNLQKLEDFATGVGGGGGVPTTRNIIAGAGLTGGGTLAADRTLNVVADNDGSIVVTADAVKVGVLATDAQHGDRGGASLHAAVTTSVNGFMTAADKVKLNGISPSAAVASVGATAPITSSGGATPTIGINPASGSAAGSQSNTHYTLLANAAAIPTASVLALRDNVGGLFAASFSTLAASAAQSGIFRAAKNVVVLAARNSAGNGDINLISTDNADQITVGDPDATLGMDLCVTTGGRFALKSDTDRVMTASLEAISFFGDPDPAHGSGVINIYDAPHVPSDPPGSGALLYSAGGAVSIRTPTGPIATLNPVGEGADPTIDMFGPRHGRVSLPPHTASVILSIDIPDNNTFIVADIDIIGCCNGTAFNATRKLRARRASSGAQNVEYMTFTGIADSDDTAGCLTTAVANGNAVDVRVATTADSVSFVAKMSSVQYFQA
jgi:hypothetical protein